MTPKYWASANHLSSLTLITIILCQHGQAESLPLKVTETSNVCSCPGDIVTYYECTVFGGAEVTTIWKGDFFRCPTGKRVIELVHAYREDFNSHTCNDGNVVARIVRVENTSFISQLNVTLTRDVIGKSIECISDNGTNTERVGLINLTSARSTLPLTPENISSIIIITNQQLDMIIFKWSAHSPSLYCQAAYYKIIASRDCGRCPTTTNHTNVACTDIPIDGRVCMLAIQTVVCSITGELISAQVDINVVSKENNRSSGISPALVSAIILGAALVVSLGGFTTVTVLLIKSRTKVQQTTASAATATLDRIASEAIETRLAHDIITTNENVAYVVHL